MSGWLGASSGTAIFLVTLLAGCGNSSTSNQPSQGPGSGPQGANVLPIAIGGSGLCTKVVNQACVSVTICVPGSSQCQIVSDILLDTASIGLRVFRSVLTVDLSAQIERDSQGNAIGECVIFGTGADWGPVATAGVILADEPQVITPIHLIDARFAGQSAAVNPCGQPVDETPANAGLNGVLGIDAFLSDSGLGLYFSCQGQTCGPISQPPKFVQNPVAALAGDNNGYVIHFPAVGSNGAATLTGTLKFGVGTQPNNMPPSVSVYTRDAANRTIATTYKGTTYAGFLDTGSTFLFFPDATIPVCTRIMGAFCPPGPLNLSAVNRGVNQTSGVVDFQVTNAETLANTGHAAFDNIGGPGIGIINAFDWGLPFFLGRTVYTGIAGRQSPLGDGPYWAY